MLGLLRPDGHIAFRGPLDRPELLVEHGARIDGASAHGRADTRRHDSSRPRTMAAM